MSEVVNFTGTTRVNLDTSMVRQEAKDECPEVLVCFGYDEEGKFYFSSSIAEATTILWLIETAKRRLMDMSDDE